MKLRKLMAATLCCALITNVNTHAAINKRAEYITYINDVAERYQISPELIESIIYYESNWDENARSKSGAIGLMQVTPKWNKARMKRLGVNNLTDPKQNILCGVDILSDLSDKYEVYEALVAYNCGEYSAALKNVQNGARWEYAEKILAKTAELEEQHGK